MKTCIFCGEKCKNKTKEHVLPRWLIKMTGDPNREIRVGLNYNSLLKKGKEEYRYYSIDSF